MKFHYHKPPHLNFKTPHIWLASWFGSGFMNPASGTWGTVAALPFGVLIVALGELYALIPAIMIVTALGFWAAAKFDQDMGGHDSKMIVIDEVAGMWIALIPAALNWPLIIVAFLAFRFFDILKPWPVSFFDKSVDGAAGVMCDDLVAGLYAALCVMIAGVWL